MDIDTSNQNQLQNPVDAMGMHRKITKPSIQ